LLRKTLVLQQPIGAEERIEIALHEVHDITGVTYSGLGQETAFSQDSGDSKVILRYIMAT
jgi:hypothetical protein